MTNVKCKHCKRYRYEWCRCIDDSPDPDILRGCSYFIQKTNADHIRSMTDEELARFIAENIPHGDCLGCSWFDDCLWDTESCSDNFLNWLKQLYKEET